MNAKNCRVATRTEERCVLPSAQSVMNAMDDEPMHCERECCIGCDSGALCGYECETAGKIRYRKETEKCQSCPLYGATCNGGKTDCKIGGKES